MRALNKSLTVNTEIMLDLMSSPSNNKRANNLGFPHASVNLKAKVAEGLMDDRYCASDLDANFGGSPEYWVSAIIDVADIVEWGQSAMSVTPRSRVHAGLAREISPTGTRLAAGSLRRMTPNTFVIAQEKKRSAIGRPA